MTPSLQRQYQSAQSSALVHDSPVGDEELGASFGVGAVSEPRDTPFEPPELLDAEGAPPAPPVQATIAKVKTAKTAKGAREMCFIRVRPS